MFEQAFRNIDDVLRKEAGCITDLSGIATLHRGEWDSERLP